MLGRRMNQTTIDHQFAALEQTVDKQRTELQKSQRNAEDLQRKVLLATLRDVVMI